MRSRPLAWLLAALALGPLWGCFDAEHLRAVEALGPEYAGRGVGAQGDDDWRPLHRYGQPCLTCHGGDGPGEPEFSLAGTLYAERDATMPLPDALVTVIDQTGARFSASTNCVGNFYFGTKLALRYPIWVSVSFAGVETPMLSPVYAQTSCATCHIDPPGPGSTGTIYFTAGTLPGAPQACL